MSNRITVAVPVWNQLNDSKGILGLLKYITSEDAEFLIIDNGSTEPYEDFIRKHLKPNRLNYIKNPENIGLVKTYQQIYENCNTEVLAILHNDTFVYEKDWDRRVLSYFNDMPDLGAASFFGVQGCGIHGERIQDVPYGVAAGMSNLLEAEIHGMRMDREWRSAAIFDGLAMVFRMETLKKSNGFDQRYQYHHIYDRDAALESLRHGYKNIVIDVPCHHLSGLTANRSDYQEWINEKTQGVRPPDYPGGDKFVHDDNSRLFAEKWGSVLPLYVEDNGEFRVGTQYGFRGNAIKSV